MTCKNENCFGGVLLAISSLFTVKYNEFSNNLGNYGGSIAIINP